MVTMRYMKNFLTAEDFIVIAKAIVRQQIDEGRMTGKTLVRQQIDQGRMTESTLRETFQQINHGGMTKSTLRRKFPYINDEDDEEPPRYPEKHRNNVIDFSPPSLWHQALSKYLKSKYISFLDLTPKKRKELMESDERIPRWVCGFSYQHILPETCKIFYLSD